MRTITAALLAGLLFAAAPAHAQIRPGTSQAGVDLGFANPLSNTDLGYGDTERFGYTGPAFGFDYLYQLQRNISVGGDYNYKFLGTHDYPGPYGGGSVRTSAWTLLAMGRVDLMPDNNLRPYGLVGLGIGGASRTVDYPYAPGYYGPAYTATGSSVGLAFALGVGLDYDINPLWLAGAELRYSIIGTDKNDIGADSVSTFDVLFKVGYKFGGQ